MVIFGLSNASARAIETTTFVNFAVQLKKRSGARLMSTIFALFVNLEITHCQTLSVYAGVAISTVNIIVKIAPNLERIGYYQKQL